MLRENLDTSTENLRAVGGLIRNKDSESVGLLGHKGQDFTYVELEWSIRIHGEG